MHSCSRSFPEDGHLNGLAFTAGRKYHDVPGVRTLTWSSFKQLSSLHEFSRMLWAPRHLCFLLQLLWRREEQWRHCPCEYNRMSLYVIYPYLPNSTKLLDCFYKPCCVKNPHPQAGTEKLERMRPLRRLLGLPGPGLQSRNIVSCCARIGSSQRYPKLKSQMLLQITGTSKFSLRPHT